MSPLNLSLKVGDREMRDVKHGRACGGGLMARIYGCLPVAESGLRQQPARIGGPLFYSHKELNSSNNHVSLKDAPELQKGIRPSRHLDFNLVIPRVENSASP